MTDEDDFDYQAYLRENPPDPTKIRRGIEAREQRRRELALRRMEAESKRQVIHVDEDILQQFNRLAVEGQSCEQLINQALRLWLAADGIREMPAEIKPAVQQSLSDAQLFTEKAAA